MSDRAYCSDGGWLVPAAGTVPADPKEHQTSGRSPHVGCNRVRCSVCGELLISRVGYEVAPDARAIAPQLFASADWGPFIARGQLVSHPSARLYVCRCRAEIVVADTSLAADNDDMPTPTWACDGHPIDR